MQYARELLSQAIKKGEELSSNLQFSVPAPALPFTRAASSGSGGEGGSHAPQGGGASSLAERVYRFKQELNASRINLHAVKRLAFHGIPDKDNLRAIVWKVGRDTEGVQGQVAVDARSGWGLQPCAIIRVRGASSHSPQASLSFHDTTRSSCFS